MRSAALVPAIFALLLSTFVAALRGAATAPAIDYSHAGYQGGGVHLPNLQAKLHVEPTGGDDTLAIQGALDAAEHLPIDTQGFRGAVVLRAGVYRVSGTLRIRHSGTVLRGAGATLLATGNTRRTLIEVHGETGTRRVGPNLVLKGDVPAGSRRLPLASIDGLSLGQRIIIRRPSTKEWIDALGMAAFTGSFKDARLDWWPGSRDLEWERKITMIDLGTRTITVDAPLTSPLEAARGGGTVHALSWPARLQNVGVENLVCVSAYDPKRPRDEEHAWFCVSLDQVENAWVQDLTARHFASAAVWVGAGARAITVEDARSEKPIAENGGWRRHAFYTRGQQVLFLRCTADEAREAFVAGFCSAGPNAFVDCSATGALGDSGSFESWATGALFDRVSVQGAHLVLANLGPRWQGAGWAAAFCTAWNCQADALHVESPPGASNWIQQAHAVSAPETGSTAKAPGAKGSAVQPAPPPPPPSLYRAQLAARLGEGALAALVRVPGPPKGDHPDSRAVPPAEPAKPRALQRFEILHGRFAFDGSPVFAAASSNAWWKGQTVPARAAQLGYHPQRWAPGLHGPGLTEDLDARLDQLVSEDVRLVQLWPGLWYDRRRDDHTTETRANPEVWAPFYEMPWARSGEGTASDGLSRYDLTRFNPWYFSRLQAFTEKAAARGVIVYHHLYNHHNLVEAAAHWTDFPWRSANCLQDTGFTEPPAYEKDGKRIGIVAEFYDVSHPVRRELHRLYIRHCLDALKAYSNVIYTVGFQFAGPQRFQEFFLDTVEAWQKENGSRVHVALNTSKAVTDALLKDERRRALVDVLDLRYWQYLPDGTLFAPHSNGALAFREQRAAAFGKDAVPLGTPQTAYQQAREYRDAFPNKAIIAPHAGHGPLPLLMAGAAYPLLHDYAAAQPLKNGRDDKALFAFLRDRVGKAGVNLQPIPGLPRGQWGLTNGGQWLLYSAYGDAMEKPPALSAKTARAWWFNPRTGHVQETTIDESAVIRKPTEAAWLLWLTSK